MAESLVPVALHGATILAVLVSGIPHVSIRSLCEALGLDFQSQRHRILRHPVMTKGVVITATPSAGGQQQTMMLPLSMLNGWLFGISASRVKPELRERLVQYQRECFDVLAAHFGIGQQPTTLPALPAQQHRRLRRWLMASDGVDAPSFVELPDDVLVGQPADLVRVLRIDELRRTVATHEREAKEHRDTLWIYADFNRPGNRAKWLSHEWRAAQADCAAEHARDQLRTLGAAVPSPAPTPAPARP